jgi:type IV pilus assembly protein PilA
MTFGTGRLYEPVRFCARARLPASGFKEDPISTFLRERLHDDDDDGFTLIELMVVVLIIAILIAIAIPTFLGAQDRARDRAAQSNLRNALTAVKIIATDDAGLFTSVDLASLQSSEGALSYESAAAPSAVGIVAVQVSTATLPNTVVLMARSGSGTTYSICADSRGSITFDTAAATAGGCTLVKW